VVLFLKSNVLVCNHTENFRFHGESTVVRCTLLTFTWSKRLLEQKRFFASLTYLPQLGVLPQLMFWIVGSYSPSVKFL